MAGRHAWQAGGQAGGRADRTHPEYGPVGDGQALELLGDPCHARLVDRLRSGRGSGSSEAAWPGQQPPSGLSRGGRCCKESCTRGWPLRAQSVGWGAGGRSCGIPGSCCTALPPPPTPTCT
jgi:hypothetical protein